MKKEDNNKKNIIGEIKPIIKEGINNALLAWSVGSALLTINKALKK